LPKYRDPKDILNESLANIPPVVELHPPVILRAEVWPYPELDKLWVRVESSAFTTFPNFEFAVYDPDGQVVSTMFVVEARSPYQSLTMHLRQPPRTGERYRLEIELNRENTLLDTRVLEFDLVYRDPVEARKSAQTSEEGQHLARP
jgi:hypothetical protein